MRMSLDDKRKQELVSFINERVQLKPCSLCQANSWTLSDTVWEMREFQGGSLYVGGPVLPVIAITCNQCGNTHFLNAIVARAVKPEEKNAEVESNE